MSCYAAGKYEAIISDFFSRKEVIAIEIALMIKNTINNYVFISNNFLS